MIEPAKPTPAEKRDDHERFRSVRGKIAYLEELAAEATRPSEKFSYMLSLVSAGLQAVKDQRTVDEVTTELKGIVPKESARTNDLGRGYNPEMFWDFQSSLLLPKLTSIWARVSRQLVAEKV
ncbi:MAG TPA: hypothetical protein VGR51_00320, partial [Thermoplasmata archaeon]|nr:hypothetical protein [Thermoplasmata archaeon]